MFKVQYWSKFNKDWKDFNQVRFPDKETGEKYIKYLVSVQQWVNDTFQLVKL